MFQQPCAYNPVLVGLSELLKSKEGMKLKWAHGEGNPEVGEMQKENVYNYDRMFCSINRNRDLASAVILMEYRTLY